MTNKYLTIEQAAKLLGVHWQTIRNYIKSGKLKYFKLGRTYRIELQEIRNISQLPLKKDKIEVEKRFLLKNRKLIEEKVRDLNARLAGHSIVIDHWFVPKSIESINTNQEFFQSKKGFGLRIREIEDFYSKRKTTFLEVKKLVNKSDHTNCLESEIVIQNYQETKDLLHLMDLKEVLALKKTRVIYVKDDLEYIFDSIKDVGESLEIEIKSDKPVKQLLKKVMGAASKIGLTEKDMEEKSITFKALDKLGSWK